MKRGCFFWDARARNTHVEAMLNLSCPAQVPKATVQAALAGLPLDAAIAHEGGAGGVETKRAEVILALGVLAILITAPLGAAAVAVSGERLLVKAEADDEESNGEINRR